MIVGWNHYSKDTSMKTIVRYRGKLFSPDTDLKGG